MQVLTFIIAVIALGLSAITIVTIRQIVKQYTDVMQVSKQQLTNEFTKVYKQQTLLKVGLIAVIIVIAVAGYYQYNNKDK